jgi:hypothetical protein
VISVSPHHCPVLGLIRVSHLVQYQRLLGLTHANHDHFNCGECFVLATTWNLKYRPILGHIFSCVQNKVGGNQETTTCSADVILSRRDNAGFPIDILTSWSNCEIGSWLVRLLGDRFPRTLLVLMPQWYDCSLITWHSTSLFLQISECGTHLVHTIGNADLQYKIGKYYGTAFNSNGIVATDGVLQSVNLTSEFHPKKKGDYLVSYRSLILLL